MPNACDCFLFPTANATGRQTLLPVLCCMQIDWRDHKRWSEDSDVEQALRTRRNSDIFKVRLPAG